MRWRWRGSGRVWPLELSLIKITELIKKQNEKLSILTVAGVYLSLLTITIDRKFIASRLSGEQKMSDISDSDKKGSSDEAPSETIEIKVDRNNPTSVTTVRGEYSLHGYKGAIEVEATWSNGIYIIHALRYMFERGAVTGKNPRFEIHSVTFGGPILAVHPPQDGQWRVWGSSTKYTTSNTVDTFEFYFVFDAPPDGVWRTDRKRVKIYI